ncbi:ATP-binding protein [Nannocystis sp.]|uniref:PAS domain-containing sensor histidine kinase n=1 Tax=Nannocystis sp. TaxID=1962667 RepID=UPI002425AC57|nr:ATP-binding protein [Nannocystis sp.]MBK7828023.1 PAS domain S-box protein [Nannocystis sp.]MBK9752447.1 PAS domain S-box protein [Nannocystis sp.]
MEARREVDEREATGEREPSASEASWLADLLQRSGSLVLRMQVQPVLRVVEVVGALEGLSGLAPAELADNPSLLWRLVHPDDRLAYAQALAADEPRTLVVRWQRGRGPTLWTEHVIRPWRDQQGQGFAAAIREVTARVEALRELASTREALESARRDSAYFHTLIHTVNDGILVNDVDGRIEFVNVQLAGLLRATPGEMIGRHIFDYMDDESAAAAKDNLRRRREGEEDQFDFRWRRKDGSEFWTIVAAKPMYDAEGEHRGSLVAVTDISRRKMAEDELLRARNELEERVAERTEALALEVLERRRAEALAQTASLTKSRFLANMSHELRTPLNAILGYAELLLEDEEVGAAQQRTDVERIRGAAEHLLGLINNILDLSKIEAAKMDVSAEEFVLGELVADLRSTILPLVIKGQNRLQVSCSAEQRSIVTDRTKLKQIVLNLLSNASKFTQKGSIELRVTLGWDDGVEWLTVAVSDTGIGIPAHKLANLFQVFSQADDSVARRYGGTGLGLAISRELCRLLGGEITVRSEVGEGTTFTLRIPVLGAEHLGEL